MLPKIGKAIIILSFIISLNPFVIAFMVPFFLVGACLVWTKRVNILSNVLWSVLPIILWYPTLILVTLSEGLTDQKIDIYFEENFTGYVTIVSNMKCGQPVQKKNGREQLYIPSNGILMYKGNIRAGIVNHRYYYKMKNDSLVSIPQRSQNGAFYNGTDNKPPSDLKVVWSGGRGTRSSHVLPTDFEYEYITMAVGSLDSLEVYNKSDSHNNFDEITDMIVSNCLKKLHTTSALGNGG